MDSFIPDAVDCNGLPADRAKIGGWVSATLILGIEMVERLSSMGIAVNLVTYLVGTMHLSSSTSSNIVSNWAGTMFLLCLFGGFLSDSFLGRYWTISIFAVIQTLGTGMLAVATKLPRFRPPLCNLSVTKTCQEASSLQMGMVYLSLYTIAVGTGGIKSSVSGFGTDQFDEKDKKEKVQMVFFFNRFYFLINIGTLLAVSVLVYIQEDVGRSWGYGICSISMFLAIVAFLSGTKRYRYKKYLRSPMVHILQVLVAAIRKRKLRIPPDVNFLYEDTTQASQIRHTNQFHFLDKASVMKEEDYGTKDSSTPNHWKLCSVTMVEEVKMVVRLLPIWATSIMFWTIHAQMITFSVQQASTMERSIGKFKIPAGSFTVFFSGATMITLAIYDQLIMPAWKKLKGNQGFTNLQKIGIGLAFSIVGMAAAALAEVKRLSVANAANQSTSSTLPITAFLLLPQFIVVGAGEAFIYTGQLDFFITQSPKGMRAMSTGLFLTTISLGYFVSSLLVTIVKKATEWLAKDINDGRLDCFYGLLAVISFINLGLYVLCALWYKKSHKHEHALQMVNVTTTEKDANDIQEV